MDSNDETTEPGAPPEHNEPPEPAPLPPDLGITDDAQFVSRIDSSGAEAVEQLAGQLAHQGVTFVVARLETLARSEFDATGLTDLIGSEHFHPTVEAAVRACVAADPGAGGPGYRPGGPEERNGGSAAG